MASCIHVILAFSLMVSITSCQDIFSNKIINLNKANYPKLYWNTPSFQCRTHDIYFTELAEKYGFVQNENDDFRGQEIAILYDPGAFPAILEIDGSSRVVLRNGGVPQEGNITFHLDLYKEILQQLIPDKGFKGVGVIDFESWRPIFRQNFGTLVPYKELSIEIEKKRHPLWPDNLIQKEAARRFEISGRKFMEETLMLSKQLRPLATWGYYAYPYCFNMSPNNMNTQCSLDVQKENDRIEWLFRQSDNSNPSLYMPQNRLNPSQRVQMIKGRIEESKRLSRKFGNKPNIIPYFWYNYQDTKEFLSKEDLRNSFRELKAQGVDGVILWGSSNDVNSKIKCQALYNYIDSVLGPIWNST